MKQRGVSGGSVGLASLFVDESPESFPSVFQKLVDNLPEQIALLDSAWTIVSANRSWSKAVAEAGFHDLERGCNYRDFCKRNGANGHATAAAVARGLDALDKGERKSFTLSYKGVGEIAGRDFELRIALFEIGGQRFATVTRIDLTELHYLRQIREGLAGSLDDTRQSERERIGRELHDSTMQFLIGAALSLGHLRRSGVGQKARALVSEIEGLVMKAQNELRSMSYLAHAHELEKEDLGRAATMLVDGFARRAGIRASIDIVEPLPLPAKPAQVALYRVLQEAISNVHRHSGATEFAVRLASRGSALHLVIADNGVGFPNTVSEGVGLQSMHSRLREIGGRLRVRHLPKGVAIIATAPLVPRNRAAT